MFEGEHCSFPLHWEEDVHDSYKSAVGWGIGKGCAILGDEETGCILGVTKECLGY